MQGIGHISKSNNPKESLLSQLMLPIILGMIMGLLVFNFMHALSCENADEHDESEYFVQAFLHKYETFNLSSGKTVKLPMDQGEGQKWNISPKNLYSTPKKIKIKKSKTITITLDNEIPPIKPAKDTEFISSYSHILF